MTASPSPSAIAHGLPTPRRTPSSSSNSDPMSLAMDIPRRPSPWHDLAHSLSSTSIGCRRSSGSVPRYSTPTPPESVYLLPTPPQSSYILTNKPSRASTPTKPRSSATGHVAGSLGDSSSHATASTSTQRTPVMPASLSRPRLRAEHDKAGHIEYKLKLLDPSAERFEKLVTQMLWRLKEGKGEAIYEIGLADDGTVVGLSRNDMEASLRTLELMAAEIGATVIILKEIILAGSGLDVFPPTDSPLPASVPKKKSREWTGVPKWKPDKELHIGKGRKKYVVFDQDDLAAGEDGLDSDDDMDDPGPSGGSSRSGSVSEDGMTFTLDLDASHDVVAPSVRPLRLPLSSKKARRAEERRSARRLDLLRGDGTGPLWIPGLGPELGPSTSQDTSRPIEDEGKDDAVDRDPGLEDMFHDPFATLSLSFAAIRLIPAPPLASPSDVTSLAGSSAPSSCSSSTYLPTVYDLDPPDRVCIEALIVRKNVHGDGISHRRRASQGAGEDVSDGLGNGQESEVDDEWYEYGGADDSWGFGGNEDLEDG